MMKLGDAHNRELCVDTLISDHTFYFVRKRRFKDEKMYSENVRDGMPVMGRAFSNRLAQSDYGCFECGTKPFDFRLDLGSLQVNTKTTFLFGVQQSEPTNADTAGNGKAGKPQLLTLMICFGCLFRSSSRITRQRPLIF